MTLSNFLYFKYLLSRQKRVMPRERVNHELFSVYEVHDQDVRKMR